MSTVSNAELLKKLEEKDMEIANLKKEIANLKKKLEEKKENVSIDNSELIEEFDNLEISQESDNSEISQESDNSEISQDLSDSETILEFDNIKLIQYYNNINIVITPIAGKKKKKKEYPCSKTDFEEQLERLRTNQQVMWDDSKFNNSKSGDIFIFWHYKKGVEFHKILGTCPPNGRLKSWSNNVGQTDRQVLYLSNEIYRMNWDEWLNVNGARRCMGTNSLKKGKFNILKILNDNNLI